MNAKVWCQIFFLIGFSFPLKAQLVDSFNVVGDGKSQSETNSYNYQVISCEAAELLVTQDCILETAIMYSELVVQYHFVNDAANLDKACRGLFRIQFMTTVDSQYTEKLKLCRPKLIASLSNERDWDPMFITQPIFKLNDEWLNSATPGVAYKVSVQFDIDEWGNPYNFDFNADDKFLLRYPVIEGLRNARYIPAVKNGKAVKKSKNIVEVVFCLDRGTTCIDEN